MKQYDYAIYDVFASATLAGNPLAVVFDADDLDEQTMQAAAREFNLSETVFVLKAENPSHTARLRIFTPAVELPFAGHPTVGGAVALAHRSGNGGEPGNGGCDTMLMVEEALGDIRCIVRPSKTAGDGVKPGPACGFAEFDLPRVSRQVASRVDHNSVAEALGLSPHMLGFENHAISVWSAGVAYVLVPVRDLASVEECVCNGAAWENLAPLHEGQLASAFVYCRGGLDHSAHFHARMFAPQMGLVEDPATGSAVAALSGAILEFDGVLDGHHSYLIEQGVEMGRPSKIHLHVDVTDGAVSRARIGGDAVRIAEGRIFL